MTIRVGLVVFEGVTLLDVSGPADAFRLANSPRENYDVVLVSPSGGPVTSSSRIAVGPTVRPADVGHLDTLMVAGGDRLTDVRHDLELLDAVAELAERPHRVSSVCTGAFVLAELGLLDDRRATTHWRHAHALARRYPRIRVEPDVIHIRDGRYVTSAGITAGIDLTLALIEEDLGSSCAREVARELVVFLQRPGGQSQFSTALRTPTVRSDALRRLMDAAVTDPAGDYSVESMATEVGVSTRHLSRMFLAETGMTPAKWLEEARLDAARHLILEGHPVTRAAVLSGFGTDETLRRVFARHMGTTPTAFRERFATTHGSRLN